MRVGMFIDAVIRTYIVATTINWVFARIVHLVIEEAAREIAENKFGLDDFCLSALAIILFAILLHIFARWIIFGDIEEVYDIVSWGMIQQMVDVWYAILHEVSRIYMSGFDQDRDNQ